MKNSLIIILFTFIYQSSLCQITHDSTSSKLKSFNKIEKIEYVGSIKFYLHKSEQIIVATQNGKIKWNKNLLELCSLSKKTKIRGFYIRSGTLNVSDGKKTICKIEIETGKLDCINEGK